MASVVEFGRYIDELKGGVSIGNSQRRVERDVGKDENSKARSRKESINGERKI